jgi:hypothetical protein
MNCFLPWPTCGRRTHDFHESLVWRLPLCSSQLKVPGFVQHNVSGAPLTTGGLLPTCDQGCDIKNFTNAAEQRYNAAQQRKLQNAEQR